MKKEGNSSRRIFLKQSSLVVGAGFTNLSAPFVQNNKPLADKKMASEAKAVTVDLMDMRNDETVEQRLNRIIIRMDDVAGMKPDIICLPELFTTTLVKENKSLSEIAEHETYPGTVISRLGAFANKNKCYIISPIATKRGDNFYNSSILINRSGKIAGVYNKIHPKKSEIISGGFFNEGGVLAGATGQPVFQTDFGLIGMQISDDVNWDDGWDNLKNKGADIVFFSSLFPGGRMLNYYAFKHGYYIVSSTVEDARVIDISGNDLDSTSDFIRYAWANLNTKKVTVSAWPTNGALPEIFKKYGDRVSARVWKRTNVITMESRDEKLRIEEVLKEFDIPSYENLIKKETEVQNAYRPGN